MDLTKFKDSGDLFLPKGLKNFLEIYLIGSTNTLFYITLWSIMHFISGLFTGYFFLHCTQFAFKESVIFAFVLHTLWELWQYLITNTPSTLRGLIDTIVDTILFMFGFILMRY